MPKIYRSRTDRQLAGICGGIAEAYGLDSNVVRLVFFFLTLVTGILPLLLTYFLAWIIIPRKNF